MNRAQPTTGRRIVTALLVATAVVHAVLAARLWAGSPALAVIDAVVAVAALAVAGALLLRDEPAVLLGAAVVGGVGVATFLVPGLVAVAGGQSYDGWLDPWAFGALLLDALAVRVAVFTLRRAQTPAR
ncbi:hypothetical protein [Pseudonocardia sp. KRD291]|uniref:hypothetical protein n=1 Tax=Pseudonocardia sp. KRD291 TaxID=2792007 RepID=UPI001C4A5B85|nr:hypothetical protein [Pseudonocardia sp. KRD291]MBW0105117.1 hypothetical protein [Pseudonocardia sp. KRD291]